MWSGINSVVNTVFDLWLWPWQSLSPIWQICITAIPVTIFALLVFRLVSNQAGIVNSKDKIKAYLLELWLYKDDLGVLLRAQGQVFRYSFVYMRYALLPMAVMIIPVALVIVQIESLYAFKGLSSGKTAILAVTMDEKQNVTDEAVRLSLPDGLAQETPPLRINETGQILWRIRADSDGEHEIGLHIDDKSATKQVIVGSSGARLATTVYRSGDWRVLGYPAESPVSPDIGVLSVELDYPRARGEFAGLSSASWILMGVTLVLGFALRGIFGVTF